MLVTKKNFSIYTFEQRIYLEILKYSGLTKVRILQKLPPDAAETVEYFLSSESKILSPTQIFILRKYYGEGMSMEELSKQYQMTHKTIRYQLASGLEALRKKDYIFIGGITKYKEGTNGSKP